MFSQYMEKILEELFKPSEYDLLKREDNLFTQSIEEKGIYPQGHTILYYPGGYLEKDWKDFSQKCQIIDMPGHLIAENNRIISSRNELEKKKQKVKKFIRRSLLKAEIAADIPNLFPKNLHTYFPRNLEKAIYNSAPILNKWAIEQFKHQEQETIQIIKRQLLENVILRD